MKIIFVRFWCSLNVWSLTTLTFNNNIFYMCIFKFSTFRCNLITIFSQFFLTYSYTFLLCVSFITIIYPFLRFMGNPSNTSNYRKNIKQLTIFQDCSTSKKNIQGYFNSYFYSRCSISSISLWWFQCLLFPMY